MKDEIPSFLVQEDFTDVVEEDFVDAIEHGILVSNLSRLLSKELGEKDEFCNRISMAGLLHDIGKLKLSKYLYGRNREALKIEEMNDIRMHSTFSYNILLKQGFDQGIIDAVYHHHENYDGSGYPDNLKGKMIPWEARILRTCDVFGALISERPYRAAFDVSTAMELMIDEIKNFDMRVFLAFQRVVYSDEFAKIEQLLIQNNQVEREKVQYFMKEIIDIF